MLAKSKSLTQDKHVNQNIKFSNSDKKRILIYLSIVFGIYFSFWIASIVVQNAGELFYRILQFPLVFMGTPILATIVTRKATKDTTKLHFNVKVWKSKRILLFSALVPTTAIFMGGIIFYLIFPSDIDYSGTYISKVYGAFGAPQDISFTISSMIIMGIIILLISSICIPVWFIALGEDLGWQGYLLSLLCKRFSIRKAVIITNALWGFAHAPLIYWGLNYGKGYKGAPFTGIVMMVLVCIVLGIWMSFVTTKTKNCMFAGIIHGASDIIGDGVTWISLGKTSTLLGPAPTGIIGLSILIVGAMILLWKLPRNIHPDFRNGEYR